MTATAAQARLDLTETIIELVIGPRDKARLWRAAAATVSKTGHRDQALELVKHVAALADQTAWDDMLLTTVELMCELELVDQAKTTADRISAEAESASALTALAESQARTGDQAKAHDYLEQAWRMTKSLPDYKAHRIVRQLADAWLEMGGITAVRQFAGSLPPNSPAGKYLQLLVTVEAARTIRVENPETLAQSFTTAAHKDRVRIALTDAATARGDFDLAEATARSIADHRRLDRIEQLAEAMLIAGQRERAEELIWSTVKDSSDPGVLRVLAADPDPGRKIRATADVLKICNWTDAVAQLVEAAPSALDAITEELTRVRTRQGLADHQLT